jgi:hypothetical protein
VWLFFVSGWAFGIYFFAKNLIRENKLSAKEGSSGLSAFPIALGSLSIAIYLYFKNAIGQQPACPEYWYIVVALLITGSFTLSLFIVNGNLVGFNNALITFFSFGKPAKKCKNCGHLAFWADQEKCKYCKQPLSAD